MGNSQSSDFVDDDHGSLLQLPVEHSQQPDHLPGLNAQDLAQPQPQQAQESQHPEHPVPASQPVLAPSHSRLLPLSLAPPRSRLLPLSLAPQQNHVPAQTGSMSYDLTADSPSTSPQRDHHPRAHHSKKARAPGLLVDKTTDSEVRKGKEGMAQQQPCGSSYTIDLTADDGGEVVRGSNQENLASQRALQKRPLPQSLVQHGAPPAKLSARGSGRAPFRQAAHPQTPHSSLPTQQAAAQVLPQHTLQSQQQQQQQQLQQQLMWQQQSWQQLPTSATAATAAVPLSDEFFLNQLNVCDQHQQRYRQGMSQMEALMESGEYAGKKMRPEQLDKARMQRDMCAQMIERVGMQRSQCLAQYEAWLNSGQAPSLGVSASHPRLLPPSLALNQHVHAQQQQQLQQQQLQQQQGYNSTRCKWGSEPAGHLLAFRSKPCDLLDSLSKRNFWTHDGRDAQ
ncbi:hypothetical protein DUNSADRAFT_16871 [Dunaliella salina]|uniref:Uncharacterized protein n=1 Tax=Dunaliella salina TaxID=3046 RepID=A0ABQ7H947_DUNSA|nr:hypothetical protein DUNSADRAFT_16871 [Dunaliella salina]|eukprot:KAF5843372.1 hypothetical protein DUNSADRAFT_16871 [Dunaliella salina]